MELVGTCVLLGMCFAVQNALKNVEEECTHLQMMYQSSQDELEQLVERSEENIQEIRELNDKFKVCVGRCVAEKLERRKFCRCKQLVN